MAKQKVLVVDDEPRLIRHVREVLTATGYAVLTTRSGTGRAQLKP